MKQADVKRCIEVLRVPPTERSSTEIAALVSCLTQLTFFRSAVERGRTTVPLSECCQLMTMKQFPPNSPVACQGDPATEIFVVLNGTAEVPELEDHLLSPGQSFGESDLGGLRNASLRSRSKLTLAVLTKESVALLHAASQPGFHEAILFLKRIPFFQFWTKVSLQKLILSLDLETYKRGSVLYREGDRPEKVYIIKTGQVKMTQHYAYAKSSQLPHKHNRVLTQSNIAHTDLQIIIKQERKMFGHEELLEDLPARRNTCVTLTDASIYSMSRSDFALKVKNPATMQLITNQASAMKNWERSRLVTLKQVEALKSTVAYSPRNQLRSPASPPPSTSRTGREVPALQPKKLPPIIVNLMTPARKHRRVSSQEDRFFQTEVLSPSRPRGAEANISLDLHSRSLY